MKKQLLSTALAVSMVAASLTACTNGNGGSKEEPAPSQTAVDNNTVTTTDDGSTAVEPVEELGYTFGEHFYSDDPVTYSMSFSDASWYPMTDKWKTATMTRLH